MTDIANAVGVSQAAVSYVLNDKPQSKLIRPQTRTKILDEAKRLRYTPHSGARSLRLSKTETLCFIASTPSLNLSQELSTAPMLFGLCSAAAKKGYRLLIETESVPMDLEVLEKLIFSCQSDGVVLMGPRQQDPRFDLLNDFKFPGVFIGHSESQILDSVDCDNVAIGFDLTKHLLESGRTRIAIITGDLSYVYHKHRIEGYKRALKEAGLPQNQQMQIALPETWRQENDDSSVRKALDCLLKLPNPPDAIISGNDDQLATTVMRNLQLRNISIPEQIAVAGINNSLLSHEISPSLTSVDLHFDNLGHEAAKMLIERIKHPDKPPNQVTMPHSLIIRESTSGTSR